MTMVRTYKTVPTIRMDRRHAPVDNVIARAVSVASNAAFATPVPTHDAAAGSSHGDDDLAALTACAICLDANKGLPHHCRQCAPGAWACCVGCEVSLLDRLCPVCRGDYARAPREWSPLAAQQDAEGECVTSVALAAVPSQLGLVELAITFPRLERLSIVIPRQESRSRGSSCFYVDAVLVSAADASGCVSLSSQCLPPPPIPC